MQAHRKAPQHEDKSEKSSFWKRPCSGPARHNSGEMCARPRQMLSEWSGSLANLRKNDQKGPKQLPTSAPRASRRQKCQKCPTRFNKVKKMSKSATRVTGATRNLDNCGASFDRGSAHFRGSHFPREIAPGTCCRALFHAMGNPLQNCRGQARYTAVGKMAPQKSKTVDKGPKGPNRVLKGHKGQSPI